MNPVINALGVLDHPSRHGQPSAGDRSGMAYSSTGPDVDARSLADARASGLTAVNITLGHVAGSADLDAVRAARQNGVIYGFQNTEMLGDEAACAQAPPG